jgi:two-component system NtrC family sensor kinase
MQALDAKHTRRMILVRVLLVPGVTVMLVAGTLIYYFAVSIGKQVETKLADVADGHRQLIEQFLLERSRDLQYIAASNKFDEISNDKKLKVVFGHLQDLSQAFFDIGVFDEKGNHVAYVGPFELEGKNYAEADWFRQVREKPVYVSDVFLGYRNIPHFVIAVRADRNGHPWYIRATIDSFFFHSLVENIRIGKTGEAYLITEDGIFQTRRRSGGTLMELDPDRGTYTVGGKEIKSFTAPDRAGNRYLYAVGQLEPTGWILVVRREVADAFSPLIRAVFIAVASMLAGGAVVLLIAFFLASVVANELAMADMEKRRMGSQLIMAGKLAEVGEMSAGVAHEINNPLQVMKSEEAYMRDILTELESDCVHDGSENLQLLKDSIDQIGLQIDRCGRITKGLLGFARRSETRIHTIDLHSLIAETVAMIERRAQVEDIRIVQEFETGLPEFESDPNQLQQVFINLLHNALDALKKEGGGEIRIHTDASDDDIIVQVADNGCGIKPEDLEKVFIPFFTTKPVGQGTGLGLSTCYGIIEALGGQITVASELNVGTVFTIRLPISGPPEDLTRHVGMTREGGLSI